MEPLNFLHSFLSLSLNKNRNEQGENNVVEEHNGEENGGYSQETEDGGNTAGGGGGDGKNAVVLKIDLHCAGCATKTIKRIRVFEGVVKVELHVASRKFSVTGKVDPVKLRDTLQKKPEGFGEPYLVESDTKSDAIHGLTTRRTSSKHHGPAWRIFLTLSSLSKRNW